MKIAQVRDTLYPYTKGGAQKRVWEISKRLAGRGHEVHIYGMKYWDGKDIIQKDGIYLHGVCKPQKLFVDGKRSIGGPICFAFKVLGPLIKNNYDIVVCDSEPYFHCFSGKIYSSLKRVPLIITWLEFWDIYWYEYLGKKGIFGRIIERITLLLTENVISISENTQKDINLYIKRKGKIIPCGINFNEINCIKPCSDCCDIVFAGRLIKDKNVDLLVKSIKLIYDQYPMVKCIIIGDGPEKNKLEALVKYLELQNNITFTGFLDNYEEVISYIKSSKFFVLPSTREGFGIVALEANACGVPVITVEHKKNAASDFIQNGVNGFVCSISETDIANAIISNFNNSSCLKEACIDTAKKFDWEEIVDEIESYYESCCKNN